MEQTTTTTEGPKRPGFLKVLCILSFIGTGLGLVSGLFSWWTYNQAAKLMGSMGDLGAAMGNAASDAGASGADAAKVGDAMNQGLALMGLDPHKQATSALIVALLNVIIFGGAFMMWQLKKSGFYLYTLGQLAQIIVPFIVVGGLMGGMMGIVTGIFGVAFIIMYGVNLKHMH
ncbi:MAG TPA: hypothetical protein VII99_01320 [Bacteroidia bacterium]